MSYAFYKAGDMCFCAMVGQPEQYVRVGAGPTPRAAMNDMIATPIQSAGKIGEAASKAIAWARRAWALDDCVVEMKIDVGDDDFDKNMSAWDTAEMVAARAWVVEPVTGEDPRSGLGRPRPVPGRRT